MRAFLPCSFSPSRNPQKAPVFEPTSVLDHHRSPSPSPPNSASTLGHVAPPDSSSLSSKPDPDLSSSSWLPPDLPPIPSSFSSKSDEWDAVLSATASACPASASASDMQGQTFLHWIMGDVDHHHHHHHQNNPNSAQLFGSAGTEFSTATGFGIVDQPGFLEPGTETGTGSKILGGHQLEQLHGNASLPMGMFFQDEAKPVPVQAPFFHPPSLLQHSVPVPNPSFFVPLPFENQQPAFLPPNPKRQSTGPVPDIFLRTNNNLPPFPRPTTLKPKADTDQQQTNNNQQLLDLLFEAARMVEAGNSAGSRGILARLNQTLTLKPSLPVPPLVRAAFYFKEALQLALHNSLSPSSLPSSPFDIVLKLGAFKAFSESSPVVQFANFTCTQTLLEELNGAARIHVIDFDIGVGGQWASFMQELAQRHGNGTVPVFKLTVFVSRTSHHPLELHLTQDSLAQFASEIGVPFEFNVLNLDSFDPVELLSVGHEESVAVNLPVGPTHGPSLPTLLRLVKQLNPKIVVSVDHGFDRTGGELSFAQHFFHAFQACMFLLDSIDSTGTNCDLTNKIERYVIQPRVESAVLGRYRTGTERLVPSYRTLFAGTGFVPVPFSNFTETQAECILKRVQVRGFHVEKKQGSLVLYWQRGELVSVSAWRC